MDEIKAFMPMFRKLYVMWLAHKWEREARKALRALEFGRAEIALAKFDELKQMI